MSNPSGKPLSQAQESGTQGETQGELPAPSTGQNSSDKPGATPRSSVSTLGLEVRGPPRHSFTSDEAEERLEERLESNIYSTSEPSPPFTPLTDPNENLYKEIEIGTPEYTKSIEEDLEVLKGIGFIIDIKQFLGAGFYGQVFKGVYGQRVTNNTFL